MCGFSEGYALKNVYLIELRNGRLTTIIDLNICNIHGKLLDGYTITVKENVTVQGRMHPVKMLSRGRLWWPLVKSWNQAAISRATKK